MMLSLATVIFGAFALQIDSFHWNSRYLVRLGLNRHVGSLKAAITIPGVEVDPPKKTRQVITEPVRIPGFGGRIVTKADPQTYFTSIQQYATTSKSEWVDSTIMNPGMILYPRKESEQDVIAAVNYARENGMAIAVRTGGHQYSGASSTSENNIQLDIEDIFTAFDYDRDTNRLRVGISQQLGNVNAMLKTRNIFLPHGECFHVHVGGHCQSGGYGQLARGFGLFGDHIQEIEFITADGQKRVAKREAKDQDEKDLFYAITGGSPGNFGIVTHLVLSPHKDEDHPMSRATSILSLYTEETLSNLLTLMAKLSQEDPAQDIDYTVSVIRFSESELYRLQSSIPEWLFEPLRAVVNSVAPFLPPVILTWGQWSNVSGNALDLDDQNNIFHRIENSYTGLSKLLQLTTLDWKNTTAMSLITPNWVFPISREYDKPFVKRASNSNSTTLVEDGWGAWAAKRVEVVYGFRPLRIPFELACQFQLYGGNSSACYTKRNDGSAYAMRDCTVFSVTDAFYDPGHEDEAMEWQDVNFQEGLGEGGKLGKFDRRAFWASWGTKTDGGHDLMTYPLYYYDNMEMFNKLVNLKNKLDPQNVFSANKFGLKSGKK